MADQHQQQLVQSIGKHSQQHDPHVQNRLDKAKRFSPPACFRTSAAVRRGDRMIRRHRLCHRFRSKRNFTNCYRHFTWAQMPFSKTPVERPMSCNAPNTTRGQYRQAHRDERITSNRAGERDA